MQEKSFIKKKILQFIEYKGISKYKFYQETGITRGILDQDNGMSEENTTKFLVHYPEVSTEWLFLNKGNMINTDRIDEKNSLSDSIEEKQCEIINLSGQMKIAPLIPIDVTRQQNVRIWDFVQRHKDLYDTIPDRLMPNFNLIHIVRSDVLQPAIDKGDILFLDHLELSTDSIVNGHIYFMDTKNNGIVIKRIFVTDNKLTCYSLRKKVPVKTFDLDEIYDIFNIVATLKFSIPNIDDDSEDKVDKLIDANQSVITQNDKLIDELSAQRKLIERLVGKAG